MKNIIFKPLIIALLFLGGMLTTNSASAIGSYTASVSGNWSSSTTWGGSAPPFNLTTGDQVTIGTGITVTMDSTVTVNGVLAQISVAGTLTSNSSTYLNVTIGTLTGAGTINVGHVMLNSGSTFSFTGNLSAITLQNSILNLSSAATLNVSDTLTLVGILGIQTGGVLGMGSSSTIDISGGGLSLSGGTLNLSSSYNVNYISSSSTAGMELSGSGLKNINVNVGMGNTVTLSNNVMVNDTLMLTSGSLTLNSDSLVINGRVMGSGTITGDASADLTINTTGGTVTTVAFTSGGQLLNNFTINVGSGNSVMLASGLTVAGNLGLTGGSNLNVSGMALTLDGSFSGSGMLLVNSASSVAINSTSSIVTPITFSGSSLGKFLLNVGTGNTVTLGENLTVDTLSLQSGTLVLNNSNLSVSGDIAAGGNGLVFSTASSTVSINTVASTSGMLAFAYPGNIVNNFNIAIGGAGSVTMGSDVVIQGALNFTSGYLNTGSYNVQIASGGSITGTNSNSYVVTDANGMLTLNATTTSAASFPVGTTTAYLPAVITLSAGSSTGTVGVNVSSGVYSQGTGGSLISSNQPLVDATWNFETSISSGLNYSMMLGWSPASEVNGFVLTNDYISHYTGGNWDVNTYAMATNAGGGMYSLQRGGLTLMSPFAIFDSTTAPTGVNEIANTNQFRIYPNPATDNINVVNSGSNKLIYVDVINTLGQTIGTFKMDNSTTTTIPLKGLIDGVYFLKLYNDDMNVVEKFIKTE